MSKYGEDTCVAGVEITVKEELRGDRGNAEGARSGWVF